MTTEFPAHNRETQPPAKPAPPLSCDAHMHIYGDAAQYPPRKAEHLYELPDAGLNEYLRMRSTLGFERTVFVQPTTYGNDHSLLKDTLREHGASKQMRGVAIVNETTTDQELEDLDAVGVRCARFIFRRSLGVAPTLEGFRRTLDRISEFGWFAKVFGMPQDILDLADELRKIKTLTVLDHMGRLVPNDPVSARAFDVVHELLRKDNWWVMLSNGDRSSLQTSGWSDIVPFARSLYDAAPERCIWGTDWPHVEYRKAAVPNDGALVDLLSSYLPDDAARANVLSNNAGRLFFSR